MSSEFSGHNPLYIMGALLAEVPSAEGEPPPRLVFLVRDDAVSIEPRHGKWNTDELIAYYRGGGSFRDRDDWEEPAVGRLPALRISTRNRTAGQVVRAICKEMDYSHHWSSGPETHIVIGPDEETGDPHHCMRRRAYLLPQQRDWLDPRSLPCRLPPYGPGWAMDRSTGIVVVIGDGSHVGCFADILKSIGAELVYESYEESM